MRWWRVRRAETTGRSRPEPGERFPSAPGFSFRTQSRAAMTVESWRLRMVSAGLIVALVYPWAGRAEPISPTPPDERQVRCRLFEGLPDMPDVGEMGWLATLRCLPAAWLLRVRAGIYQSQDWQLRIETGVIFRGHGVLL